MKKYFSILAIAMMAICATTLVSCGSDDDDNANTKSNTNSNTKTPVSVTFVTCLTEDQVNCYDISYVISIDGKESKTVKLSDMKELQPSEYSQIKGCQKSAEQLNEAFKDVTDSASSVTLKVFSCNLGSYSSGKFTVSKSVYTVKEGHPTGKESFVLSCGFYTDKDYANGISGAEIYKGIDGDDDTLNQFASTILDPDHAAGSIQL